LYIYACLFIIYIRYTLLYAFTAGLYRAALHFSGGLSREL